MKTEIHNRLSFWNCLTQDFRAGVTWSAYPSGYWQCYCTTLSGIGPHLTGFFGFTCDIDVQFFYYSYFLNQLHAGYICVYQPFLWVCLRPRLSISVHHPLHSSLDLSWCSLILSISSYVENFSAVQIFYSSQKEENSRLWNKTFPRYFIGLLKYFN